MNKYLYYSPRNFANEYRIYAVGKDQAASAQDLIDKCADDPNTDAHYITRKDAERMTANNRKLYRTGEANYCNPAGATQIEPLYAMGNV